MTLYRRMQYVACLYTLNTRLQAAISIVNLSFPFSWNMTRFRRIFGHVKTPDLQLDVDSLAA